MRELIYHSLVNDQTLAHMLKGDQNNADRVRVYQWGSLGAGDIPEQPTFPFVVIFENPSTVYQEVRETARSQNRYFLIYCYDEHGLGYLRIERVLRRVRDTVLSLPMQVSPSGARCTDAFWLGFSADSRDPDYNANMKFTQCRLVSNQ